MVTRLKNHGVIFFSTDVSPYDDADMESLAARLKMQQVKFNAVVSGDCGDKESWNEVK